MRWWMIVAGVVVVLPGVVAVLAGMGAYATHWLGRVLGSIDDMAEDWYA